MKTRILLLIAISAITLSFTFTSGKKEAQKKVEKITIVPSKGSEPIGGFVSDEK